MAIKLQQDSGGERVTEKPRRGSTGATLWAQSIVNEVIPRDRSGQRVVIPQRGATSQHFIIGNVDTELELSVESRSFLIWVNDQVLIRQKRSSLDVIKRLWKTFYDMVDVHVCNNGISSIHGEEFLRQLAFHQEHKRSHNETYDRHLWEIDIRTIRRDL